MRLLNKLILALMLIVLSVSCSFAKQTGCRRGDVSPFDYGLATAKTGAERYQVILRAHTAAVEAGVNVDYSGIDTVRLEIPVEATPIPLTSYNDFQGVVIHVKNLQKTVTLFEGITQMNQINVVAEQIDKKDFRRVEGIKRGKYILSIMDGNPWVENRKGYSYGVSRKDIILVENGRSQNSPISEYNNYYSNPVVFFAPVNGGIVVKNICLVRDSLSTAITRCILIDGKDDVFIKNVAIKTPESNLTGDMAIQINNSTNVRFEDVSIYGTYSKSNVYGYGVSLDNVWNVTFTRFIANAKWGVFGNNNVNYCTLNDCEINRFDVHCYGRDFYFHNCLFFDLYNQFSSVFGDMVFDKCTFKNFVPVLIETSYNAYTEFDLTFNDCIFYTTKNKNYLINTGSLSGGINSRYELSEKKLPRVHINNLKNISLESGKEERQVQLYLNQGVFIQERNIDNIIKL